MTRSRRPTPSDLPPPLALTLPHAEVGDRLQQRITLGKEIQSLPIQSHEQMGMHKEIS
jgi:hypothetical protein